MLHVTTKKVDNDFFCSFCNKKLHLTTDCCKFDGHSIKVPINLRAILFHICKDCNPRKSELSPESSITLGIDAQKKEFQQQMEVLTEKIIKSSNQNASVQRENRTFKFESISYRTALGNVPSGRVVISSNTVQPAFGIRARGIPEG